jgi:ABC-2 type transport system ATP-binding protein
MTLIEVQKLIKNYGKIKAVKGISFTIEQGEIFGLIGPNGAGKTTTLRVLATLLQITDGNVSLFGIDLNKHPDQIRKQISYLPEDAGAYKNLTGRQYLEFIARFFNQQSTAEMIEKGINIANLDQRIDDKIDTYSKGMKRRLLVGRALMNNPKLAILDEPTSGLDVRNAQEIRSIIKSSAQQGTIVLLSSHNMLEVEYLCKRIALIANGQIIEEGKPTELKRKYNAENVEEVFMKVV